MPPPSTADAPNPLVSVVIPTYDRPEYLARAVKTVTAQTYDTVELVVVDDCSPTPAQKTIDGVDTASLASVQCLRHEENRGANAARNTGIEAASGDLLAFLDDDDEWAPEKLACQVAAMRDADDDVGVVYTGTRYVDTRIGDELEVTPTNRGWVTEDILTGAKFGEFSVMLVRREAIEAAGLPDERFPSWQDREWYLRLSRHCAFKPVPEPLTTRHIGHGDQITDNFRAKRDISYPLFLEKHRDLAAEYDWATERRFVASLSAKLGWNALRGDHYHDARRYLGKALVYNPLEFSVYPHFVAALGGRYTHRFSQRLLRAARSVTT